MAKSIAILLKRFFFSEEYEKARHEYNILCCAIGLNGDKGYHARVQTLASIWGFDSSYLDEVLKKGQAIVEEGKVLSHYDQRILRNIRTHLREMDESKEVEAEVNHG